MSSAIRIAASLCPMFFGNKREGCGSFCSGNPCAIRLHVQFWPKGKYLGFLGLFNFSKCSLCRRLEGVGWEGLCIDVQKSVHGVEVGVPVKGNDTGVLAEVFF